MGGANSEGYITSTWTSWPWPLTNVSYRKSSPDFVTLSWEALGALAGQTAISSGFLANSIDGEDGDSGSLRVFYLDHQSNDLRYKVTAMSCHDATPRETTHAALQALQALDQRVCGTQRR